MAFELVTESEITEALAEASRLDRTRGYSTGWVKEYKPELEIALRLQMRKTANQSVKLITHEATTN